MPTRASATRRCSCSRPHGSEPLDVDAIRDHLESIGESVLVAGDAPGAQGPRPQRAAGPGHRLRPDAGLAEPDQRREPRQPGPRRPRDAGGRVHAADGADRTAPTRSADRRPRRRRRDACPLAVVAVAAGDGLAAIFRDFGVPRSSMAASRRTRAPASCSRRSSGVDAREVLLLPNNPNVVLAARQVAAMTERPVAVVPTRNAAEGFAALLALDPTLDAAANAGPMTEAGRAIQTRRRDRGRPRRDDRRQEGQARPDDRARPGRRARRGRRRPREGRARGDGGARARASSSSRSSTATAPTSPRPRRWPSGSARSARRRGRGPPRRPAVLPVPDLGRVGVRQGDGARPRRRRPTRSSCCRRRSARPGLDRRGQLRRAGHPARVLRRPRPAVPPAAPLRRPARDAASSATSSGPRTGRSSRPGVRVARRPRRGRRSGGASSARSPASRTRPARSTRRGSGGGSSSGGCTRQRGRRLRQAQALRRDG